MDAKIKVMVDTAIKAEKEILAEGGSTMMTLFAFDKIDQSTMIVFADYDPAIKKKLLMGVGAKLREQFGDNIKDLMLVSDAYMAKANLDVLNPAEEIIMHDVKTGKRRLENLPPEFHKLRTEALIIVISQDLGKKMDLVVIPHKKVEGKIIFEEQDMKFTSYEDNMLRYVWEGYAL